MSSSIFKVICATAAFLASPSAAQIGNWDIIYQSLDTNFTYSATNEITMEYLIGTGRAYEVDLFDKGCSDPITGMTIAPVTVRTVGVSADHDGLGITVDLDKTQITSSNIWSSPKLELCVRVQLLSNGGVIKEDKRDIDIAFDFLADFEADDVTMQTASLTSGSGQANVESYVTACKCDDLDSLTCNTIPLTPNSILYVCIQSIDPDVELDVLQKLELIQVNTLGNETLLVVDGLAVQDTEISSIPVMNKTAVGVATVVPSRFFDSGAPAMVTGQIQVKLVGSRRRLISFGPGASPTSKVVASTRAMRGETIISRPGYGNDGFAFDYDLTTGYDDSGESLSGFALTVGLERETKEIPLVVSAYQSSGNIKAIGFTHFLGASACFLWAFFW